MLLKSNRFYCVVGAAFGLVSHFSVALGATAAPSVQPSSNAVQPAASVPESADASLPDSSASEDIDDRFATEGYLGVYGSLLQQTIPAFGITGSIYLDDDFRFGADISRGSSKFLFGAFKSQGAAVWGAWELADSFWLKSGLSYSRLDKPSAQEPLAALTKGIDKKIPQIEVRSDSLGVDVSFGQLWSYSKFSIAADYLGFTLPVLRLTGPKLPLFALQAARIDVLYNFE